MLFSPKPQVAYTSWGRGPSAGLTEPYWNLAWLTLPDVDETLPWEWEEHPIKDAIQRFIWVDLLKVLEVGYPLEVVDTIVQEGIDDLALCEPWEADTFDTMVRRAREAEGRLRIADGSWAIPDNVIVVDFGRRNLPRGDV